MNDNARNIGGGSSDPDPSIATSAQIFREIQSLKELLFVRLEGLDNAMTTRLDAMDRAVQVFSDNLTRVPTDVDKQVGNLKDRVNETFKIYDEKLAAVEQRFHERDVRSEQGERASRQAIESALEAAEKAVAKSEVGTVKQMDQQSAQMHTTTTALESKISDVKDRLTLIEGRTTGSGQVIAYLIAAAGIGIAVVSLVTR
jgi:hypothetical protein